MDTLILREKKVCKKFWQHSRLSWLFQLQWIVPFCKKNSSNSRNNVCFEIKNSILPDKTEKISNIYFLPCGLHVLLILALMTKRPSLIGKNCWWFQSPLKSYNFWFALWNFQTLDQWRVYMTKQSLQNYIVSFLCH